MRTDREYSLGWHGRVPMNSVAVEVTIDICRVDLKLRIDANPLAWGLGLTVVRIPADDDYGMPERLALMLSVGPLYLSLWASGPLNTGAKPDA